MVGSVLSRSALRERQSIMHQIDHYRWLASRHTVHWDQRNAADRAWCVGSLVWNVTMDSSGTESDWRKTNHRSVSQPTTDEQWCWISERHGTKEPDSVSNKSREGDSVYSALLTTPTMKCINGQWGMLPPDHCHTAANTQVSPWSNYKCVRSDHWILLLTAKCLSL